MLLRPLCLTLFTCIANGQSAAAGEWVFGLGGADLLDEVRKEAVAALVEYHSDPFYTHPWADLSWMGTAKVDTTNNNFFGAGVYAFMPISDKRAFLEASFAVGGYYQGTFIGKHADDVLFRSSLGGGVRLSDQNRISLSIDHLLDDNLKNEHPGKESIMLRYTRSF